MYTLVVREEYWDRQFEICANLCRRKKKIEDIKKALKDCCTSFIENSEKLIAICIHVYNVFNEKLKEVMETLSRLFEDCEITKNDSFDIIYDKLENRMIYLNRKEYIRQEQYYKMQFKLIKLHYNIMNKEKRC